MNPGGVRRSEARTRRVAGVVWRRTNPGITGLMTTECAAKPDDRGPPDCTALVIFGITVDLVRKKILASLYEMARAERLPPIVLGVGRPDWSEQQLRAATQSSIENEERSADAGVDEALDVARPALSCMRGDYCTPALYEELSGRLQDGGPVLFYFAVPSLVFPDIVRGIASTELADRDRLLIEKPFGSYLASAQHLYGLVDLHFQRSQLYGVDHYLEKESVQKLLVLRFANTLFEAAWSARHIASVAAVGSVTETYVRARLTIDNDRWRGVGWTVTAGKALDSTRTEIEVLFKPVDVVGFVALDCRPQQTQQNRLILRLAPAESMTLNLQSRKRDHRVGNNGHRAQHRALLPVQTWVVGGVCTDLRRRTTGRPVPVRSSRCCRAGLAGCRSGRRTPAHPRYTPPRIGRPGCCFGGY